MSPIRAQVDKPKWTTEPNHSYRRMFDTVGSPDFAGLDGSLAADPMNASHFPEPLACAFASPDGALVVSPAASYVHNWFAQAVECAIPPAVALAAIWRQEPVVWRVTRLGVFAAAFPILGGGRVLSSRTPHSHLRTPATHLAGAGTHAPTSSDASALPARAAPPRSAVVPVRPAVPPTGGPSFVLPLWAASARVESTVTGAVAAVPPSWPPAFAALAPRVAPALATAPAAHPAAHRLPLEPLAPYAAYVLAPPAAMYPRLSPRPFDGHVFAPANSRSDNYSVSIYPRAAAVMRDVLDTPLITFRQAVYSFAVSPLFPPRASAARPPRPAPASSPASPLPTVAAGAGGGVWTPSRAVLGRNAPYVAATVALATASLVPTTAYAVPLSFVSAVPSLVQLGGTQSVAIGVTRGGGAGAAGEGTARARLATAAATVADGPSPIVPTPATIASPTGGLGGATAASAPPPREPTAQPTSRAPVDPRPVRPAGEGGRRMRLVAVAQTPFYGVGLSLAVEWMAYHIDVGADAVVVYLDAVFADWVVEAAYLRAECGRHVRMRRRMAIIDPLEPRAARPRAAGGGGWEAGANVTDEEPDNDDDLMMALDDVTLPVQRLLAQAPCVIVPYRGLAMRGGPRNDFWGGHHALRMTTQMNEAMRGLADVADWVAFMSIDEYLVPTAAGVVDIQAPLRVIDRRLNSVIRVTNMPYVNAERGSVYPAARRCVGSFGVWERWKTLVSAADAQLIAIHGHPTTGNANPGAAPAGPVLWGGWMRFDHFHGLGIAGPPGWARGCIKTVDRALWRLGVMRGHSFRNEPSFFTEWYKKLADGRKARLARLKKESETDGTSMKARSAMILSNYLGEFMQSASV